MTDQISISGLPLSQPLTGSEKLPMDQGPSTVQATAQQIANLAPKTDLGYIPATRTLTSSTGEDIEIPEASATVSGLLPAAWISGATAAILPHIHGALAGPVYEHVRNVSGAPMPALTPYHVVGSQGDTDTAEIVPADASDPQTMPASGITLTELAASGTAASGHGAIAGVPTGVNTAGNSSGTVLYVGSGVLTPTPPAANVQALAIVGRSHATTGTLAMLSGPALARVAFSGDYNHLDNKPTLGTAATRDVGTTAGTVAAGDAPAAAISTHVAASDPHTQYLQKVSVPVTLAYAATVNLDMAAVTGTYQSVSLVGNVAFTTSNRAAGRMVTVYIYADATQRNLSFPAWRWIGAVPTVIAASKVGVLVLHMQDGNDANCIATYGVQP